MASVKTPSLKSRLKATTKDERVTSRLQEHLVATGDNSSTVDTQLLKTLMRLVRERQDGNRSGAWHPSQLHQCERSQVFQYLDVPVKAKALTAEQINLFNDGTWRHIRWQMTLLKAGILTHAEVKVRNDVLNIDGHLDGENANEGPWAFELKGTSQFEQVMLYGALPQHKRQIHGYFVARPDIECFSLVYEDKSTQRWHEIIVYPEPKVLKVTERIVNELQEAVDHQRLPEVLTECEYGEGAWKQCPYAYLCKQVQYAEAEAAAGCADYEEVFVELGLKRRNKHKDGTQWRERQAKARAHELGTAETVRAKGGTLRIRRGIDG